MPKREQIKKPAPQARETEAPEAVEAPPAEDAEALLGYTDDLLEDIDSLLEETEVLVNYRQRGGQ